jgi:hypothetical protein
MRCRQPGAWVSGADAANPEFSNQLIIKSTLIYKK